MTTLPQEIEKWKKSVLEAECAKCDGHCCAMNLPFLTEEQVKLLFDVNSVEDAKSKDGQPLVLPQEKDTYHTLYENDGHCPKLKDGKCTIYNHPLKPKDCAEFPFFLDEENKTLSIHNFGCPVTEDLTKVSRLCKTALYMGYNVRNFFGLPKEITQEDLITPLAQLHFEENLAIRKAKRQY